MNLLDQLNEIQGNPLGTITRQRLRAEKRRMQKDKRSEMKQSALRNKSKGGAAVIRKLPKV